MTVREFFERFGVSIGVVAVLTALVVLLPGDDAGDDTVVGGPAVTTAAPGAAAGGPATTGPSGAAGAAAPTGGSATAGAAGGADPAAGGASSGGAAGGGSESGAAAAPPAGADCRSDGRNKGISFAIPPCVPTFSGDNGGATAQGVEADKIIVARYVPQTDPATRAALTAAGANDSPENLKRQYDAIRAYGNHHYETYGREVVFVDVEASGPDDNDAAMRADAIRIAEEIGAFAAMLGTSSQVLAEELGARDVTVVRLTAFGRNYYKDKPKRVWASLPTMELYYTHVAEYIGKRLHGRNAVHAGDDQNPLQSFNEQPRKFGLVWIEGVGTRVDPEYKVAADFFKQELAKYGASLTADASYTFDLPRQQQQSTNIISKMRAAGVSNITFIGDPLYPAFLTREATRQNYYPEWLITGTLLTDTTFFGRTYDQGQWGNAFGISPLWVFWTNKSTSAGYREFFHMYPELSDGEEGVAINTTRGDVGQVFLGVHMAGPNLTPDTFAQGMLDYPPTGGHPAAPLLDYDEVDPNSLKDFTEVWWDPQGTGKDEADQNGLGILLKVDGGKRYRVGSWPTTDPKVFNPDGAVFTTDTPEGISNFEHEQDGHTHEREGCRSCG